MYKNYLKGDFKSSDNIWEDMYKIDDKIYIISGNYREFMYCCLKNKIDFNDAVYIFRPDQLRGIRVKKYILYGTYQLKNNIEEILHVLEFCLVKKDSKSFDNIFNNIWEDVFDLVE